MLMHDPGNRRVPAVGCRFAMSCTSGVGQATSPATSGRTVPVIVPRCGASPPHSWVPHISWQADVANRTASCHSS
jgi:hypothetical protein